jgi:hypothetical protein
MAPDRGLFCFRSEANLFAKAEETKKQRERSARPFILAEAPLHGMGAANPISQLVELVRQSAGNKKAKGAKLPAIHFG